jgi:hypothetical protein
MSYRENWEKKVRSDMWIKFKLFIVAAVLFYIGKEIFDYFNN